MSSYDIRGMQASGMNQQQINDFIKKAEANAPKMLQDFKSQIDPQKVVAGVQKPVKQSVKPQVMPQVMPNPRSIPRTKPSVPDYLQPGYAGLQGTPAPNSGPRAPGVMGPKVPVKPQVMPPVKPNPVKGQQVGSMPPVKKGLLGGINPNAKPPAGIDVEKIRQGVQSLPKAQQGDDFVSKQQSNMPFSQRVQGLQQLGQNNASMMKKGGEAKKYTKGGKINLDACGVSTAQKSKSSPKW